MARIKYSGLISDLRGRLGEVIASTWKTGVGYVKKMPTSVANPNSTNQESARESLSWASKAWLDTLNAFQRAEWDTYALSKPGQYVITPGSRELVGSNNGIMSGQNAFCLTNGWLVNSGQAVVVAPPLVATPPTAPTTPGGSFVSPTLTVTWTAPSIYEANAVVRVHIASVSGIFHKQVVALAPAVDGTVDILGLRGAKGSPLSLVNLAGSRILIQLDCVNPTGGKSQGSTTVEVLL